METWKMVLKLRGQPFSVASFRILGRVQRSALHTPRSFGRAILGLNGMAG